jgi:hypothetical protein
MLIVLMSFAFSLAAVPNNSNSQTIVVEGKRINDAEGRLSACLARRCSPDQDIDATLALAEWQLMAGKYRDARTTLLSSLKRNNGAAAKYPIPMSDLYRANGKVAANLGLDRDYYRSTWGIYRTLKHGLPSDDVRKYSALMEVAEMMYRTRGHTRARTYYEFIARQARASGRPDVAAVAELRAAIRHLPPGSGMQVGAIKRIANLSSAEMRAPVLEAKLALARLAFERNDELGAQAVLKGLAGLSIKRPILIYSPPYAMLQRELDTSNEVVTLAPAPPVGGEPGGSTNPGTGGPSITKVLPSALFSPMNRLAGNFDDMWIDLKFQIGPDGRVIDPEIVRSKGDLSWVKPLIESIRRRRYTPGQIGEPLSTRLERYTYTSAYEKATTTRSSVRSPEARVEYMDLSDLSAAQ